ncbi:MAG: SGNH/GDSL hydrolase family protein [Kiritimatiellia bacterium]|jgi:lysophospholipase L1-like esterase
MKGTTASFASILALALASAALAPAHAQTVVADWNKAGDAQGWALPAENYLKEFPLIKKVAQSADNAQAGGGSLKLSIDSTGEGRQRGRVDKYYGGKADWKRFTTFSIQCHVPEGAPAVMGQIAVMSGAWKWADNTSVPCKAGGWTKVSIPIADITNPEEIQLVMFIPSISGAKFTGDLYIDQAMLEGEIAIGPGKPGAAPESDPASWLETFDSVEGWQREGARIEPAPEAAVGEGAAKFFLPGFITKKIKSPKPLEPDALDEGWAGISFWVKGDGSDELGTLVLCGQHPQWFPFKYACSFPLKDTSWKKFTFRWDELVPEDATYAVGTPGGAPPSNIQYIKVGNKWRLTHNNRNLPKFSFDLDHLQLEKDVPAAAPTPALQSFDGVKAKLAARQPVAILCLGDSITAGTSLRNPDQERYAQVLEKLLRERCGYDGVSVVSRAVGGAQCNDLRLWAERDFTGIEPDLAIVMVGYNDKTWGYPADYYGAVLADYLDRIAIHSGGRTAVLLMPPIPGRDARFLMQDDFAEAARAVAARRNVALCDMHKVFKAFGRDGINAYMADTAHPNAKGHATMAKTIADLLAP